jgi:hypothetical protein
MRRLWVVAAVAGLVVLLPSPAHAKGAGLELDEQIQGNEAQSADEVLYARNKAAAKEYVAGGPYLVYLSPYIPDRDLRQAPPLPTAARRLGKLEVRGLSKIAGTKRWSIRVGVDFKVPPVIPGTYRIDVCNDPCTKTIEELYPTVTRVVSGPLEERVEERINNVQHDLVNAMYSADRRVKRRARKDLNNLRDYARVRLDRQGERIDELTTALQSVRRAAADKPFPTGIAGIAFAGGAMLASAGWFFSPKVAHRATLSKKKKTSALGGAA